MGERTREGAETAIFGRSEGRVVAIGLEIRVVNI